MNLIPRVRKSSHAGGKILQRRFIWVGLMGEQKAFVGNQVSGHFYIIPFVS